MTDEQAELSPRLRARIAGAFYLVNILTGALALGLGGRLGLAAILVATLCYVVVTLLFYGIFKPVNGVLSLIAALVSIVGCVIGALGSFRLTLPSPLVFFGLYCLLIGYLILRSTFLPRVLGVLMAIGGLGWLTFASPQLANQLAPYNMAPGIIGEGSLTVWLLVAGVNAQRWKEQAGKAASIKSGRPS
jgi:hypothetical protein